MKHCKAGCGAKVEGRFKYCDPCGLERQRASERLSQDRIKESWVGVTMDDYDTPIRLDRVVDLAIKVVM